MRFVLIIVYTMIISLSVLFAQPSFAESSKKTEVNILSWWGYFASPWIHQEILDKCHVKLSYDEYYTNGDFMRRLHEYKELYDLVIFPDMDYQVFKSETKNTESSIYKKAENYEPHVKNHYKKMNYSHNISYFLLSLNGFIYNPRVIKMNTNDGVEDIFKKSKSNLVVLSEEPIYVFDLLDMDSGEDDLDQAFKKFTIMTKDSKVILSNNITATYNAPNFAFAYTWPGIALYAIKTHYKEYKFLIHPKLSFVSADLLATLNNESSTQCVANVLSSKEFLSKMQNDALYFSPYGDSDQISSKILKESHKQFFSYLPKLKWFKSITKNKYKLLNKTWSYYFRLNSNNG